MHQLQISAFKMTNQLQNSKSNLLIRNFSNGKISCPNKIPEKLDGFPLRNNKIIGLEWVKPS